MKPSLEVTEDTHLNLDDYMNAPGGNGPLASQWADKPHRLVYDLVNEIKRLYGIMSPDCRNSANCCVAKWLQDNEIAVTGFSSTKQGKL